MAIRARFIGRIPLLERRGDVAKMVDELAVRVSARTARDARERYGSCFASRSIEVIAANVCTGVRALIPETRPARFLTAEEAHRLQDAADAGVELAYGDGGCPGPPSR